MKYQVVHFSPLKLYSLILHDVRNDYNAIFVYFLQYLLTFHIMCRPFEQSDLSDIQQRVFLQFCCHYLSEARPQTCQLF